MGAVLSTALLTIGAIGEAGLAIYIAVLAHKKQYSKIEEASIANVVASLLLVFFALVIAIGLL